MKYSRARKIVGEVRRNNNRKEKTSFCIIDAQSVKNRDTAKEKGYEKGKAPYCSRYARHAIYVTTD
ncbi:hypothetical protein BIY23_00200 [Wolbachia pipientis]|uniref:Uncharacterized protein n=1 Tax=Wolbachia pipientis TaxID=955 RepID=A0A1E7QLT8_WOLPI|nr:hypothetical protein BIY23_00200 [Wolbachia pipientis]